MATATVTEFVTTTVNATASATSTNRATPQGGIFEGLDPTHYNPSDPITLFIIQASIVIILTRLIHIPLAYLRQPRVIAEVICGIVLGPSIMGKIPGFSTTIFPSASMPAFSLAANVGLVLYLFMVGLEVDIRVMVSNWKIALSVGALGMIIPFGLGAAIAWGLYNDFRDDEGILHISFGIYLLFIGIAMAITAFPVLCRILTALKLLSTPVGIIVLSAGVGNDVVGWILLALCVALVNSGAGLTALYILLVAIGYTLFLVYIVRPLFMKFLRHTGSLSNGPTQTVVALTVLLVLASAFFTNVIGIHAIFGAFMVGVMLPHEGGFAIKLTEKLEDLIQVLFLPLYFALSGLRTDLSLLDSGLTWGYVVGVCAIAFFGKIAGGTLAARLSGLVWRESLTIGCLMSCKGLVELIVLNIGLQARILSTRTFTIFVVMALITTFATTPLVSWLYPPWYQRKLELWKQGKIDWDGNPLTHSDDEMESSSEAEMLRKTDVARRVLVYLRLDGLPPVFTMISLFASRREQLETPPANPKAASGEKDADAVKGGVLENAAAISSVVTLRRPLQVHALRLMELTERDSSVMRVSEIEEFATRDPIIKAFGSFGQSREIAVGGQIAVVPEHSFPSTLMSRAVDLRSDFVLIPWSSTGTMSEYPSIFDTPSNDPLANRPFASLVGDVFEQARFRTHVGVFIDKSVLRPTEHSRVESPVAERPKQLSRTHTGISLAENMHSSVQFKVSDNNRYRIVTLFQGGEDDLFAVRFALQLAKNEAVDLIILNASDSSNSGAKETGASRTANDIDYEFNLLRSSMPDALKQSVYFADVEMQGLDAIVTALSEPSMAETVLVLSRSGVDMNSSVMTGSSSVREDRALGPLATNALKAIREKALNAGVLVVQARRDDPESQGKTTTLARKRSQLSDDE